jgi:lysozyme
MKRVAVAVASAGVLAIATPMIYKYEGTRYTPYRDSGGVMTVCEGDTYNVDPNKTYSPDECAARLKERLTEHNSGMVACVSVPMSDGEHAAYLSFTYNVGVKAFCNSTLNKKLHAGDRKGACAELSRWTLVNGVHSRGLERRRAEERKTCERDL